MVTSTKNSNLPFVEKYRPVKLSDVLSHEDSIITLKKFLNCKNVPHLMFYGPSGTGKTSTIEAFVYELYGGYENVDDMVMKINASEERGIDTIRTKVKEFVSTKPLTKTKIKYKFVILDEADAMTGDAQAMLKHIIEKYTYNARFCLICNCIKKFSTFI